ncbi:MAG TPA: glycosyltransferase, partial [Patescibacteria group bacterium]|nr:glycosyltransferase [Patescibacteria group bacterium]
SWAIHNAKIVICRSGANTVMELGVAASVALCVPLPWSANQEQYHNAKYLEQGGGVVLPQHEATAGKLLELVQTMMATWDERKAKAQTLAARIPKDGARRFVDVIGQVVAMKSSRV